MKSIKIVLISIISLFVWSCTKVPDHYLRFSNTTDRTVNVRLDTTAYNILAGQITEYKSIDEGHYQISGDYTAAIDISGEGTYKWTVEIQENNVVLNLDNPDAN